MPKSQPNSIYLEYWTGLFEDIRDEVRFPCDWPHEAVSLRHALNRFRAKHEDTLEIDGHKPNWREWQLHVEGSDVVCKRQTYLKAALAAAFPERAARKAQELQAQLGFGGQPRSGGGTPRGLARIHPTDTPELDAKLAESRQAAILKHLEHLVERVKAAPSRSGPYRAWHEVFESILLPGERLEAWPDLVEELESRGIVEVDMEAFRASPWETPVTLGKPATSGPLGLRIRGGGGTPSGGTPSDPAPA